MHLRIPGSGEREQRAANDNLQPSSAVNQIDVFVILGSPRDRHIKRSRHAGLTSFESHCSSANEAFTINAAGVRHVRFLTRRRSRNAPTRSPRLHNEIVDTPPRGRHNPMMAQKKTSSSAKTSAKPSARVKDLSPSKEGAAKTKGGFKQGFPIKWQGTSQN